MQTDQSFPYLYMRESGKLLWYFQNGGIGVRAASLACLDQRPVRTSLDLELDFQASRTKLTQLQEEILRLREIKHRMEEARARGDMELPNWVTDNEQIQQFLVEADKLVYHISSHTPILGLYDSLYQNIKC